MKHYKNKEIKKYRKILGCFLTNKHNVKFLINFNKKTIFIKKTNKK